MSVTETTDFENARKRLDEIVGEVRSKDLSLEKSLDLYEEAIKLGTTCSQLVDKAAFTADEHTALNSVIAEQNADMEQVADDGQDSDEVADETADDTADQPEAQEDAAPEADEAEEQDDTATE